MKITIDIDESLLKRLESIPFMLRHQAADKAFRAMGKPIAARASELAPSSKTPAGNDYPHGTRGRNGSKWGARAAGKFSGRSSMMKHDSGKHMASRISKNNKGAKLIVGAIWGPGNKQHFNYKPEGRDVYYWGRSAGKVRKPDRPNFLERAYREAKSQAEAAFIAELSKFIKEFKLG